MELCSQVMQLCFLKDGYDIECLVVSKIYITLIENTTSDFPLPHEELTNIAMNALRLINEKEEEEAELEKKANNNEEMKEEVN